MMRNVSFNQNNTALAVATKLGFSLYNLSEIDTTLKETHRGTKEKLKVEQSAKAEDIFLIERHYEEPLVAVVPVTKRCRLVLWDYGRGQSFPEKDKRNEITAVKFYKRNVIVFTEFDIMMHDVDRLTYGDHHKIFTITFNPKGIHAVAYAVVDKINKSNKIETDNQEYKKKEICFVAVPYKINDQDGLIEIFDVQNWRSYGTCQLHSTPVEALAFNASGTLLASASKSGKQGNIYSVIRVFALKTEMKMRRSLPKWSFEADEKFEFRRDYFGSATICSLSFSNCSNFIIANTSDRSVSVFSLDQDVTCRKMSKIVIKGQLKEEEEEEEEKEEAIVESNCWPNCCPAENKIKKGKDNKKFKKYKGNGNEDEADEKVVNKTCAITSFNDQLRVVIVTSDLCLSVYTIPNSVDDKYACLGYYDLSSEDQNYAHNTMPVEIMKAKLFDYTIYEATAMYDHAVHRQLEKQEEQEKKQKKRKPEFFKRTIQFSDEIHEISKIDVTASTSAAAAHAAAVKDAAAFVKLEKLLAQAESTPGVSEEWGSGWTGTNFIVEIEETASSASIDYLNSQEDVVSTATINDTNAESGPKIIVRTEEVLIVGLVLMLWVGAIVLFFNRWGKIRMLEPYQPKFQQQHRSSCPLVDIDSITTHQRASVSRMSMGLVNNFNSNCQFNAYNPSIYAKGYASHASSSRQRQNSVFVGPSPNQFLMPKPPRKTRSAMDLHSMVLDESAEQV